MATTILNPTTTATKRKRKDYVDIGKHILTCPEVSYHLRRAWKAWFPLRIHFFYDFSKHFIARSLCVETRTAKYYRH